VPIIALRANGSCNIASIVKIVGTVGTTSAAQPPVADLFNQKVEGAAWRSKSSWYVLANQDQTVHPDLQRFVSKRMNATTIEVASSHVPMLSKPDVVLDVIRKAASAVSTS
jgi:hypothetical protein